MFEILMFLHNIFMMLGFVGTNNTLKHSKVWYHSNCNNRGKGCYNTNLTDHGGCCIWYDEMKAMR